MELEIYRGDDVVATIVTGGKNAMFGHGLMNQHKITVSDVKMVDPLQVQIEDYILVGGIKFKINTVPELTADDRLTYDLVFEGPKYTWHDKLFLDEGEAEFTYYGNALLLMQLFITNINEIDPVWSLGEVTDTVEKHITFSNVTCHEAILIIAEEFELEFDNQDKVITMIPKIGRDTGLSFEYGMGKGLYQMTRNYVNDKNVVTKVYGFGGTRNLPAGYRGGKRRLTFDGGFKTNNIDLYGIKEGPYTNDDIVPEREGTVSAVTHGNPVSTIADSTLDFNIMSSVIEGLEPKIGFTTGALAGEEFVITGYNPTTKVISFKGFVNNNNIVLPNDTFRAQVGDKYVFFDIDLPGTYVTTGEGRVETETQQYVLENSVPRVAYGGTIDPIHYRDNSLALQPGDRVNFKDARLGLDATIRITEITMPLDFMLYGVISGPDTINITIANFVTYTAQQRLRDEKLIQRHEVKTIDLRSAEQARRNTANLLELRDSVIDPSGNYYTEKIKPGSIETLFLAVGAKATNFNINGVAFTANVNGDANSFIATAGQLIHYDLKLPGGGFVWEMSAYSVSGLVPANKYYLYAKISKTTNVGAWELATDVKLAESVPGYFVLQAGVLFPVKDGRRDNAITKGMVFIVGDQITAGRIKSLDESMYIDLTSGQMRLGDDTYGMDWNVTTPDRLTIRGGITQNAGGISAPITLFRGVYDNLTTYYNGDSVSYLGSRYVYTYATPIFNVPPTNAAYWTIDVEKGDPGTPGDPGVQGPPGSDGTSLYTWVKYADDAAGTGLSDSAVGKEYIGLAYNKTTPVESTNPADYTWALFVGEGVPGEPGEDGVTLYTWIKYADSPTTGMSDSPTGKAYLGLAYNKTTATESTDYTDYSWSLIKGADGSPGSPGAPGADGNFTQFRFNKNGSSTVAPALTVNIADPSGEGWSTTQPTLSPAEYGWITSALKTPAGALVTNWSTPTRFTGLVGETGPQGPIGPFMGYRGPYDSGKSYVGNTGRVEVVTYLGNAYVTRIDAGTIPTGTLPTNTTYFNPFGGQFESIATGLFFATLAYIENLGVRFAKTSDSGARIEIDGNDNSLKVYDASGTVTITLKDGKITTNSGLIAGFTLDTNGLTNESIYKSGSLISGSGNSRVLMSKIFRNSSDVQIGSKVMAIGNYATVGYGDTLNTLAYIDNDEPDKTINTALVLSASQGSIANWALRIESGDIYVQGWKAQSALVAYRNGNNQTKGLRFVNGLFVEAEVSLP